MQGQEGSGDSCSVTSVKVRGQPMGVGILEYVGSRDQIQVVNCPDLYPPSHPKAPFFQKIIFILCVWGSVCIYVYVQCPWRSEEVLDPLEWQLQMVMRHDVASGN